MAKKSPPAPLLLSDMHRLKRSETPPSADDVVQAFCHHARERFSVGGTVWVLSLLEGMDPAQLENIKTACEEDGQKAMNSAIRSEYIEISSHIEALMNPPPNGKH